ncbi:MAG: hypothetical protein KatS3mg082_2398 [Nitrospiraceae bacterium]|nr:MAG: hypothetical protein KatS3mg082_2398 [Nitrospiraceae bacterium]
MLNRRPDATERLVACAETVKAQRQARRGRTPSGGDGTVEERLTHALVKGIADFIESDVEEAAPAVRRARSTSSRARSWRA